MGSDKLFVGEIGKRIIVKVGVSLADLDSVVLFVEKPDGTTAVEWATSVLGAVENGQVYHNTVDGDLDQEGQYRLYAKVTYNSGDLFYGERTTFRVFTPSEG